MLELIYKDKTIGIYNTEKEAHEHIKELEPNSLYIRSIHIKPDFYKVDFGGYHRFYYIKIHKGAKNES